MRLDAREKVRGRAVVDGDDDHAAKQTAPETPRPIRDGFSLQKTTLSPFLEAEAHESRRESARGVRDVGVGYNFGF